MANFQGLIANATFWVSTTSGEGQMSAESIALVIALVAALAAVGAAFGAWQSARATKTATEAQLLLIFLTDYSSPEMSKALRLLQHWKEEEGDGFAKKWLKKLKASDPKALEVDQARRKVTYYFFNALRLHESGYVEKRFLCEVTSFPGINIFYEIVEPLGCELNLKYDKSRSDRIRKICGEPPTRRLI